MIVYDDVIRRLSESGYSTYRLQKEGLIPGSTLDRLRHDGPISTETINTICRLCNCQPGDFLSYIPDPEKERQG